MRRYLILALALGLAAGCADHLPTDIGIDPPNPPGTPDSTIPRSPGQQTAIEGIHDAIGRIVPSLPTPDARSELQAALTGLATRLAGADLPDILAEFEIARGAIDEYGADTDDAADLDAIGLALDFAASEFID